MLKLIYCELVKLKRKRFVWLSVAAAFLFPIPLTCLMTTQDMIRRFGKSGLFDSLFHMVLGYAVELLLPCVIGVVAAMLFFMERDNDTFKNLRTIPVTSTQMVLAKLTVLFLFGELFCLLSVCATALCGLFVPDMPIGGLWYKFFVSVKMGVFITAGGLPFVGSAGGIFQQDLYFLRSAVHLLQCAEPVGGVADPAASKGRVLGDAHCPDQYVDGRGD